MGIFDKMKNAFGGGDEPDTTKGPSTVLREAGIDPSGLDFAFAGDGTVTISGEVADEAARTRIGEVVAGMSQVSGVNNRIEIAVPAPPEPEPQPEPEAPAEASAEPAEETPAAPEDTPAEPAAAPEASADKTYTVQSGDTLWNIAKEHYGEGSKYMKIFEANRDVLDNPDLIKPGQVLKIP